MKFMRVIEGRNNTNACSYLYHFRLPLKPDCHLVPRRVDSEAVENSWNVHKSDEDTQKGKYVVRHF